MTCPTCGGTGEVNWSRDNVYLSNYGNGPLSARILDVHNGIVRMKRWCKAEDKMPIEFDLPMGFFLSEHCGWKTATHAPSAPEKGTSKP